MKYGTVDMSQYPVVVLRMNEVDPTPEEIDEFFDELENELEKREGHYVSKVYGQKNFVSSETRVRMGKRSNAMNEKFKGRSRGTVVIQQSAIARMMIKGIMIVIKQKLPLKIVSNEREAEKALNELLGLEMAKA
ncbi:MAG TPA: hypothetical protein DCE41_06615 [Cytophagales bacterium]|nr:hypothetical protein [Cytophagales bacterium]HAA21873.1 hypothetical protein [Cytophagales bacterium]HAP58257.1 hypothetical protein [Cytophagales bacterium]